MWKKWYKTGQNLAYVYFLELYKPENQYKLICGSSSLYNFFPKM